MPSLRATKSLAKGWKRKVCGRQCCEAFAESTGSARRQYCKGMQTSLREVLVWPISPEEACVCKPGLIIHSIDPNKKCCAIHQPLRNAIDP